MVQALALHLGRHLAELLKKPLVIASRRRRMHQHLREGRSRRGIDGQAELANASDLRGVNWRGQCDDVVVVEPGQDLAAAEAVDHDDHRRLGRCSHLPQRCRQVVAKHRCVDDHGIERSQFPGPGIGKRWQAGLHPHVRPRLPRCLQYGRQFGPIHQHSATGFSNLCRWRRRVLESSLDLPVGQRGHRTDCLPGIDNCLDERQAVDVGAPIKANVARAAHRVHDRVTRLPHPDGLDRDAREMGGRADPVQPIDGSVGAG